MLSGLRARLGQQVGAPVVMVALAAWCAVRTEAELVVMDVPCWQLGVILGLASETVRDDIGGAGRVRLAGVLRMFKAVVGYKP